VISIALPQEFAGSKRQQSRSMGEFVGTATPRERPASARDQSSWSDRRTEVLSNSAHGSLIFFRVIRTGVKGVPGLRALFLQEIRLRFKAAAARRRVPPAATVAASSTAPSFPLETRAEKPVQKP
jgi:hypothetical protein